MEISDIVRVINIVFALSVSIILLIRNTKFKKQILTMIPPIILMVHIFVYFSLQLFGFIDSKTLSFWSPLVGFHSTSTWLIIEIYKLRRDIFLKNKTEMENKDVD